MAKTKDGRLVAGKNSFTAIGKVKVTDKTFGMDIESDSGFQYSRLNLGVEVAEGQVVYSELMGGFFPEKESTLWVRSKEDYKRFEIDFEDRFVEEIIESVSPYDFYKVGLEVIEEGGKKKLDVKRFLSPYDMIEYMHKNLKDGMTVIVKGNLEYKTWNGETQVKKEVNAVYLARTEYLEDAEPLKFGATFQQEIILDEYSVEKGRLKDEGEYDIMARVLNYQKEILDPKTGKGMTIPFPFRFVVAVEEGREEVTEKMIKKFLKVKSGTVRSLVVDGHIFEGTNAEPAEPTEFSKEIQELIELGLYSEEEAVKLDNARGGRVFKMYIDRPFIKKDKDTGKLLIEMSDDLYTAEDLILPEEGEDYDDSDVEVEESTSSEASLDDLLSELA